MARAGALLVASVLIDAAAEWSDDDIAQVGAARTADVERTETQNLIVGIVIARAVVPALAHFYGPHVYHAKRHVGAHCHVAVVVGADERIYILDIVLGLCARCKCK